MLGTRYVRRRASVALVGSLLLFLTCGAAHATTLPAGFDDRPVTSLSRPIALAFLPDGRMLIASSLGRVHSYSDGALAPGPVLDIRARICANSERGLLGMAVDPAFAVNRFVYLYYTFDKHDDCGSMTATTPVNRVSRFVMDAAGTLDPGSETVLIDNIPSPDGRHNGGDLHFGPDELLYVSVGDGTCDYAGDSGCQAANDASRDPNVLLGKVLRIERDGSVPSSNPFQGPGTARCAGTGVVAPGTWCRETWASGLRNPFRMAFDPDSPEPILFINDVGNSHWEEVDLGVAGADFGWNVREGPCSVGSYIDCGPPPPGMTNPVHAYQHGECIAITGGAFVPDGIWPAEFDDDYLYADFGCGKIFRLTQSSGAGYTASEFASAIPANTLIGLTFGPDVGHGAGPSLYYLLWNATGGEVRRISRAGNRSPVAKASANPSSGAAPLSVSLSSSGTSDPEGDLLTYTWSFADGSPDATTPDTTHTFTAGVHHVTLTVHDGNGGEDTATVRVDAGNDPPVPRILDSTPASGFGVGEPIYLVGSATDPQDGDLPGESLVLTVARVHANHTHPYVPPTSGGSVSMVGPEPEGFSSTETSRLLVTLTATDSQGLARTVTKELAPRLVPVRFRSSPLGQVLEVAGSEVATPADLVSWDGWTFPVDVPDQQDASGRDLTFISWSDGGARRHDVTTTVPLVLTVRFGQFYPRPKGATPLYVPLVPAFKLCGAPNMTHGPPLAHPSCGPPVQQSGYLTVGTPDSNGEPALSSGQVRLDVQPGSPATPADEADVGLRATITDVRRMHSAADYDGELALDLVSEVTDRHSDNADAATGSVRIGVPMRCNPTATAEGSMCSIATSLDAVLPGLVREGDGSVWQLGKLRVYDGGQDGVAATEPNFLFATQGLFVP